MNVDTSEASPPDLAKKEALFRKLDKRNEDHQAAKDRNREARSFDDEAKVVHAKLLNWTQNLIEKIEAEITKNDYKNAASILNHLSEDMQNLDTYFMETSRVLTPFDTKKVQHSVLEIRYKYGLLQDALKPKKKFGFKGDKKKAFQNKPKAETSKEAIRSNPNVEFGFTIRNRANEIIDLSQEVNGQDVMLTQLSNCTVIMKANPITLHATHLENCILYMGPVQTSVYLDHCNSCTLSLACQQMRVHNSANTKIYLHVTSKGIIEDCKDIQVCTFYYIFGGTSENNDEPLIFS